MRVEAPKGFNAPTLRETGLILGAALGVFFTAATGAAVIERFPDVTSPWFSAGAYAVPAGVAFAVYWLIARRICPPR